MELQDGVKPVEDASELDEIGLVRFDRVDLVEEGPESPDQVSDLGMGPAHGGQGVAAAEHPGQRRIQGLVLGLLVGEHFVDEEPVHVADLRDRGAG